ncbi:MAG: PPC domain-containing protein, partial [Myxococcota bacterium]|nr:PPC domain-containing protein [Myxococcota bacterium]
GDLDTVGTSTGFSVTPGDKVKVTMTGSADADLYVRFKYRPTANRFDCRPFRANSNEECILEAPNGTTKVHIKVDGGTAGDTVKIVATKQTPGTGIEWVDVKHLLDLSIAEPTPPTETSGFNWGSPCDGGSGTFQQAILQGDTVEVGEIPADKHNVRIELVSDQDVDIQLYDGATPIVMWDEAETAPLHDAGQGCTTYEGLEYCYSGYEGDGTNFGHEWIQINGNTNRNLTMKAFGYAAGNAQVNYQWAPLPGCVDQGSGTFTQLVERRAVVDVGVIPEGKQNLRITLTSEEDVDIQLFDGSTPIVMWDDAGTALLHGETQESTTYKNMMITYSGYNGDGTNYGNEFITVLGEVTTPLTMKAFGYAEGQATVDYAWGLANSEVGGTDDPPPTEENEATGSEAGDSSGGDGASEDGSSIPANQGAQP